MLKIDKFKGKNEFLSNFHGSRVIYEDMEFDNAEAGFQAAKELDKQKRLKFQHLEPATAKRMGRKVNLRADWEEVKKNVMEDILRSKFKLNKDLRQRLLDTGDAELIEGNYWHDNTWGVCNCTKCINKEKQNRLGRLLMKIRGEIRFEELSNDMQDLVTLLEVSQIEHVGNLKIRIKQEG